MRRKSPEKWQKTLEIIKKTRMFGPFSPLRGALFGIWISDFPDRADL